MRDWRTWITRAPNRRSAESLRSGLVFTHRRFHRPSRDEPNRSQRRADIKHRVIAKSLSQRAAQNAAQKETERLRRVVHTHREAL